MRTRSKYGKRAKIKQPSAGRILAVKFTKIVASIVGVCTVVVSVAAYGYVTHANNAFENHLRRAQAAEQAEREELREAALAEGREIAPGLLNFEEDIEMLSAPTRTTFLLVGVDYVAGLADTVMAGIFNHNTMDISLISIPRDTFVQFSPATVREMQARGGFPPASGQARINSVINYSRTNGGDLMRIAAEGVLGIEIDYYFVIDLAGFRDIVDVLGGVTIDVPQRMFYDPYDQPLRIDLQPGVQHLDGAAAEGFVRFRHHPTGDIFRMQNQQTFMNALLEQSLTRENVMNNAFELAGVILNSTTTNFGITDIPRYIRYVTQLDPRRLETYTLPSARPAGSFFWHDPLATRMMIDGIFWDGDVHDDGSRVFAKETLRVNVINGGAMSGLAGVRQQMLFQQGFVYVETDSFEGARTSYCRIISFHDEASEIMAQYFPAARIERADITTRALIGTGDVAVIIGLDQR
ncbi:MAG: LCP family protein [Defluviitaleaceae bacterium]|nr:LCP family protein [Defluviitaleaceae bacterium]